MELAPDPAPLLLADRGQPVPRLLELGRKAGRGDDGRGVAGQVGQEAPLSAPEPLAAAGGHGELADRLGAVDQLDLEDLAVHLAAGGDQGRVTWTRDV